MPSCSPTVAVILAGGRSSRLSAPLKWQRTLGQHSLLKHIITRLEPQVKRIIINTSSEATDITDAGLDADHYSILPDCQPGFKGPLVGLLSALQWAESQQLPFVLTVPCDMPFFPKDIYSQLANKLKSTSAKAAIVTDGQQAFAVLGLWSTELSPLLKKYIVDKRSINDWAENIKAQKITINDSVMLMNINTETDLNAAKKHLRAYL